MIIQGIYRIKLLFQGDVSFFELLENSVGVSYHEFTCRHECFQAAQRWAVGAAVAVGEACRDVRFSSFYLLGVNRKKPAVLIGEGCENE